MHKNRHSLPILIITAIGIAFFSCTKKEVQTIRINGSTSIEPFIQKAVTEYKKGRNITITISAAGSKKGVDDLLAGSCDIAMSSTELYPEHISAAKKQGITLKPFLLGYDIIIPIVNKENKLSDITVNQLEMVYSKKIKNWSELGEDDKNIEVVHRNASSGTGYVWSSSISHAKILNDSSTILPSNSAVLAYIAEHAHAIGYVSNVYLNPEVKPLKIEGHNLADNDSSIAQYPFKRPLYLYTRSSHFTEEVKAFIVYVIFNEGVDEIFREKGFFRTAVHKQT